MSLAPDLECWTLTDQARYQQEGCGIALSELYRLLRQPTMTVPGIIPGERRVSGYGLVATVYRNEVRTIAIDGATSVNWSDWAIERAEFGDSDVLGADALVAEDAARLAGALRREYIPRARPAKVAPPPLVVTHVLDRVHPALHAEITRQVAGDFSRLVIESPTRVTILPES